MKNFCAAALIGLVLFTGSSAAQIVNPEPLITDRPDFTESVEVVPQRSIQLESGYTFTRASSAKNHNVGEVLIRAAVLKRMELRIGINSYHISRTPAQHITGIDDGSIGMKINFINSSDNLGKNIPGVGLILASSVPYGSACHSNNKMQPTALLAIAKNISDRLALGTNFAYTYCNENGGRVNQYHATITAAVSLTEKHGCYVEYYKLFPRIENIPNPGYLNGGLTYLVTGNFQFDVRLGAGITTVAPDYYIGLGFAFRHFR